MLSAVWAIAYPVQAAEPVSYSVEARIDPDRGVVDAAMHVDVRVATGETEVRMWIYPDRLAVAPSAMDERSARWIFPGEVDLGGLSIQEVRVGERVVRPRFVRHEVGSERGRDAAGADFLVPVPPGPRRVDIRIRFRLDLPARFGRVGWVDDRVTLVGPWYPLVVGPRDGYRFHVPHRLRVRTTAPLALLVGEALVEPGTAVIARGPFVPVVAAPALHVREVPLATGVLRFVSPRPDYAAPPPRARGPGAIHDLVRIDTAALLAEAIDGSLETARTASLPVPRRVITVAQVPLRTELVGNAPGLVLASDRVYEVFPIEHSREFHHRAVRRAVFRHLLAGRTRRTDPTEDRGWAEDLRAVLLTDLHDARLHGHARTPQELLGFAAFHPAIDQLLYAPQVANVSVYFGAVAEPDPWRDDPERARRPVARGRRILESARDAMDEDAFGHFARLLLHSRLSARQAVARVAPELIDRVDVWLDMPSLEVNYRLGGIVSERRRGGGFVHRVEIVREGADRTEPVEVEVEDEEGNVETAVWPGEGRRGEVRVETSAALSDVTLDPRGRLPQSPRLTSGHPRDDDATSHPLKPPLLRGFGLNISPSEVSAFLDFAVQRRFDLESSLASTLSTGRASTGGTLRYVRGVGPKRHANARVGFVSGGLGFARLHSGFVEGQEGGYRLSARFGAGFDTRTFFDDPRSGASLAGTLRVGAARRDDGDVGITGAFGGRGSLTLPMGLRNALVLVGGGGWTFGDALPSEHQSLGGRFGLRAFEPNELLGDGNLFAVAEHRWTAVADMAWNFLHLAWLREIQLAVFAGAGVALETLAGDGAIVAAEVGAGVRFQYEYAGVQPGVLAVDVAFPLTRDPEDLGSDGVLGRDRIPVGLHVSFDQYF